jgi:hypothetical protein
MALLLTQPESASQDSRQGGYKAARNPDNGRGPKLGCEAMHDVILEPHRNKLPCSYYDLLVIFHPVFPGF